MRSRKIILPDIFLLCFLFYGCHAQTSSNNLLQLTGTITLPGVSGRIDHISFDSNNNYVFVSALGNNTLEVIDLKNKKVIHSIKGLHEPQGVAFIPDNHSLVVANGDNGECDFFNAAFQKTNLIQLDDDADNVRVDASNKKIYVGYGSGGIAVIDAFTCKLITEIKLPAHPESFQINKQENKMYVNIPDEKQIDVIDLTQNKIIAQWKLTEARANFPMALDEANHRLFIGCRHPSKLLVLDTQTGKIISTVDIDGDTDDLFYNAKKENLTNGQVYVSCGSGYVDVIKQTDANRYATSGKIKTSSGARTSLFIPELNTLIVAAPATMSGDAQLMIYKTK